MDNLVIGKTSKEPTMMNGKNEFELHANIAKYFCIKLKDMKAPGKIQFTYLDPGASFKAYISYSNSRPGHCPKLRKECKKTFD